MARNQHSDAFDVIPYEDLKGDWKKLGAGSFGNVYKANYLGIDVAVKEVLPSNDYDVAKYFEREWRLMKETRHPNVVLYLGLARAPDPDGRIFIISEYIDNGNLRNYIHDKHKPFPWAMRISFATDIARALAYLHARRCIHRDLKGENLLVTANGRLKITDFGFARIAARNADESRRLTFCGTDSYMSPEILMGNEFDLPTDIFSLGVIFCEIAARRLADDRHFKRAAPFFSIDEDEVRKSVSPGCPEALVQLCLDCLQTEPSKRPVTRDILLRLTEIEAEILLRPGDEDQNVGSIKFATGNKRPGIAPRIPSFGMGIGKDIRTTEEKSALSLLNSASSDEESEDEDLKEAISKLKDVDIGHGESHQALLHSDDESGSNFTDYSTTVIRGHPTNGSEAPPALSSMLTIRSPHSAVAADPLPAHNANAQVTTHHPEPTGMSVSAITIDSYRTANSNLSIAAATEGGSTIRVSPSAMVHRFTLIKTGARKASTGGGAVGVGSVGIGGSGAISPRRVPTGESRGTHDRQTAESNGAAAEGWSPFDFFFASGMLSSKCDVCNKRIGWKPALECDDCGLRAHLKCGELAPRDCGLRHPKVLAIPPPITQSKKDKRKSFK